MKHPKEGYSRVSINLDYTEASDAVLSNVVKTPKLPWSLSDKAASYLDDTSNISERSKRVCVLLNPDIPEASRNATLRFNAYSYTVDAAENSLASTAGIFRQTHTQNELCLYWRLLESSTRLEIDVLDSKVADLSTNGFKTTLVFQSFSKILPQLHFFEASSLSRLSLDSETNDALERGLYLTYATAEGEIFRHYFSDKTKLLNAEAPLKTFRYFVSEKAGFRLVSSSTKRSLVCCHFVDLTHVVLVSSDGSLMVCEFPFEEPRKDRRLGGLFPDNSGLVGEPNSYLNINENAFGLPYTGKPSLYSLTTASNSNLGSALSQLSASKVLSAVSGIFSGPGAEHGKESTRRFGTAFPLSLQTAVILNTVVLIAFCDDSSLRFWSLSSDAQETPAEIFLLSDFSVENTIPATWKNSDALLLTHAHTLKIMQTDSDQAVADTADSVDLAIYLDNFRSQEYFPGEDPDRGLLVLRVAMKSKHPFEDLKFAATPLSLAKFVLPESTAFTDYSLFDNKVFVLFGPRLYSSKTFFFDRYKSFHHSHLHFDLIRNSTVPFDPDTDLEQLAALSDCSVEHLFCQQLFRPDRFSLAVLKDAIDVYSVSLFGKLSTGNSREELKKYLLSKLTATSNETKSQKLQADCASIRHEVELKTMVSQEPLELHFDDRSGLILLRKTGFEAITAVPGFESENDFVDSSKFVAAFLRSYLIENDENLAAILDPVSSQVATQALLQSLKTKIPGFDFAKIKTLSCSTFSSALDCVVSSFRERNDRLFGLVQRWSIPMQAEELFYASSIVLLAALYQSIHSKKRFEPVDSSYAQKWLNCTFQHSLLDLQWYSAAKDNDNCISGLKIIALPLLVKLNLTSELVNLDATQLAAITRLAFVSRQVRLLNSISGYSAIFCVLHPEWKVLFLLCGACASVLQNDAASCEQFLQAALSGMTPTMFDILGSFLGHTIDSHEKARYDLFVFGIQLFELCSDNVRCIRFIEAAIGGGHSSSIMKRKLLKNLLHLSRIDQALELVYSIEEQGDLSVSLLEIVSKICESPELLARFGHIDWKGLEPHVTTILWYKAESSSFLVKPIRVNYYKLLFSVHFSKGRFKEAAVAMLECANRWHSVLEATLSDTTDCDWTTIEAAGDMAAAVLVCLGVLRLVKPESEAFVMQKNWLFAKAADAARSAVSVHTFHDSIAKNMTAISANEVEIFYKTIIFQMKIYQAFGESCKDVFRCFAPLQVVVALLNARFYEDALSYAVLTNTGYSQVVEVAIGLTLYGNNNDDFLKKVLAVLNDLKYLLMAAELFLQSDELVEVPLRISSPLMKHSPESFIRLLLKYRPAAAAAYFVDYLSSKKKQFLIENLKLPSTSFSKWFPLSLASQVCEQVEVMEKDSLDWPLHRRRHLLKIKVALETVIQETIGDRLTMAKGLLPGNDMLSKVVLVPNNNDAIVSDITDDDDDDSTSSDPMSSFDEDPNCSDSSEKSSSIFLLEEKYVF